MRPFLRPRQVDEPRLRLFVFHHAGGAATGYHPLARDLPLDWDVLLHEQPGHGTRRAEPMPSTMDQLVAAAARDVAGHLDGPYALFGHSMGAIVAVEAGRRLSASHHPPVWVGVSGRPAPAAPGPRPRLSRLGDGQLFATLVALGGTPARLREAPELREQFLRVVRADLAAVESYRPRPGRAPLPCPLTVFGGITDPWAPPASLPAWEAECAAHVRQCLFPGGHFYFLDGSGALAGEIRTEVRAALAGARA